MPAPGVTKVPKRVIDRTVKRHLEGKERVAALAAELGLVDATVYNWIKAAKAEQLARLERQSSMMTPKAAEKAEKRDLALQLKELKSENVKLRNRVLELMLKYGEI